MADWTLITYTRTSADKAWPTPGTAVMDKITEYQNTDPKKIVHYETADSADGLKKYFKVGFIDRATAITFGDTPENSASIEERENFCNNPDNGMACLVERGLEVEPPIPA